MKNCKECGKEIEARRIERLAEFKIEAVYCQACSSKLVADRRGPGKKKTSGYIGIPPVARVSFGVGSEFEDDRKSLEDFYGVMIP